MSILRSKHSGWTHEGRRTPFSGGGGGGPTQSTTVTSNIPEYAKPYVTNMFEATQQQLFEGTKTPEGGYNITGFRGYRPYSTDVNNYFAGFSPLQQQAQYEAGAMQQPGQFALGSGLTGSAGLRSLQAGNQYAQNVTSPGSMQAYMSPYQQNVTDIAKNAAVREAQIAQNTQNLGAARQGTYGGARQLLANTERERNLLSNLSNIQAQGSQSAYDKAMQAQQFGATLGMQGLGQALGAGAQLGQLGATQQGADIARQNQMATMGAQQQALEQAKINQAIQDYATQQQYPLMQLGVMSNMLRGLPMEATNRQAYVAQPSIAQQGVGLLGAGATLFGGGGRREGGAIKEYRKGGIIGYAPGGVIDSTRADLEQIAAMPNGLAQLEKIKNSSTSNEVRKMAAEIIIEKQMEARAEQQTQQARMSGIAMAGGPAFESQGLAGGGIIAFQEGGDPAERAKKQLEEDRAALLSGGKSFGSAAMDILTLPNRAIAGVLNTGIRGARAVTGADIPYIYGNDPSMTESLTPYYDKNVRKPAMEKAAAEKEQKDLEQFDEATRRFEEERAAKKGADKKETGKGAAATEGTSGKAGTAAATAKDFKSFLTEIKEAGPKGRVGEEYEKFLEQYAGDTGRLSRKERMAMAKGFLKFGSTAGPVGKAAIEGVSEYATGIEAARDAEDKIKGETAKARMELDKARRAEERGDIAGARESRDKYEDIMTRVKTAQIGAGAAGASQRYTEQQIRNVMAENPGMSYSDAMARVAGAGRTENVDVQRAKAALTGINEALVGLSKKDPAYAELMARRTELLKFLTPGGGIGGGQATQTAGAVPKDIQGILNKYP